MRERDSGFGIQHNFRNARRLFFAIKCTLPVRIKHLYCIPLTLTSSPSFSLILPSPLLQGKRECLSLFLFSQTAFSTTQMLIGGLWSRLFVHRIEVSTNSLHSIKDHHLLPLQRSFPTTGCQFIISSFCSMQVCVGAYAESEGRAPLQSFRM